MARMNTQKAQGKRLCAVMRPQKGWVIDPETGEQSYAFLEIDPEDERTFDKCRKSKKAHGPSVKNPIIDHVYGGPDGTLIDIVMPRCGGGCGRTIEKGEQYRFWAPRYGARQTRCMTCPPPSRSALTNSEILSTAWDIADGSIEAEDQSDLESQRDELAERVGEIVEMIEEKMGNIESGFGHTDLPIYSELEERRDGYEQWQEAISQVEFSSFEEANEDECSECGLAQEDHGEDTDHEFEASFDLDGAIEELENALSECPK